MRRTTRAISIAVATGVLAGVAACGGSGTGSASLPQGTEPSKLDPVDFTTEIDNPYWPMAVGTRWTYRETDNEGGKRRVVVTVTPETKTIMGIEARVVHDIVTEDGAVVEDTLDWYAQDADGNLWYLGEDTKEYENGKLKTTEGSWEAGVDGAQPGIILPAHPEPGMSYREEYYKGHAEDAAQVMALDAYARVPYGRFEHMLQTRNTSGIEPDVVEEKLYAGGVGPVLEITVSGGSDRAELVSRN
jgi:ABC-type glycerol-3-phosphate transport system substrate-binding protein